MTIFTQQQTGSYAPLANTRPSRPFVVAAAGGGVLAVLLVWAALPLLASAGLWLLGVALLLLGHAFVANHGTAAASWGSAIAAQGLGLLGLGLLLAASFLS